MPENQKNAHLVVGPSAGRIEALSRLVKTLPEGLKTRAAAARALGQRLKANRIIYGEISLDDWAYVRGQTFLVLREAVRKAVSPSGCGALSVGLDITPGSIVGSVLDDGRSFEAADGDGGVGLRSMRGRAALLDGALRLDCEPGRGRRVEVSVPLAGGR